MNPCKMFMIIVLAVMVGGLTTGCGVVESWYDEANYESLTNETGDVEIMSGGKVMYKYENAKIKYSSSDTDAIWFTTADGHDKYVQPGVLVHLED